MTDLMKSTRDIAEHFRGSASVEHAYRRMHDVNDPAMFIQTRPLEDAVAEERRSDPDAPLSGMPFAVKDNIDVAGMPTTAGCPRYAYTPDDDAPVVAKLRAAGAIPIAKSNLDQFATGLVGTRSPYGVPRNALDPALIPGGSSSGSAVAVAQGIVPFALGSDTAGSGRVPAALNGIVGLKPTLGLISSRGMVPACRTVDTVSILAPNVALAYAVLTATAGYDDHDPYSRQLWLRPPFAPEKVRLAVPDSSSRIFGSAAAGASFDETLKALPSLGIEAVPVDFTPLFEVATLLYDGPWVAERHAVAGDLMARDPHAVLDVTRTVIGKATGQSASDAFRGRYRLAELARQVDAVFRGLDGFLVPSVPTLPTLAQVEADPIGINNQLGTYTNFVNLLDLCAVTVPTATPIGRVPGSVTVIARAGQDHLAAAVADRIHRSADAGIAPLPHLSEPCAGELAVGVVGAHMSGLPLNRELVSRGARFLRTEKTAPVYKLYALPGGPPHRPGLLRTATGGAAISLEVWALPSAEVGSFLAGIPAPLGLGTIVLADGRPVHGFRCESDGIAGAMDVTEFGGWRAFLGSK